MHVVILSGKSKFTMRTHSSFSVYIGLMFFILATHKFTFSDAGIGREGGTQAQVVQDLGNSPIGPAYRQKRYKETLTITDKVGDDKDDDNDDDDESGQSEEDDEDDNDSDDNDEEEDEDENDDEGIEEEDTVEIEDKSEGHSKPLSAVRKNLSLLKNTRKSLGRYVREDRALNKLMSENSELAKEVGVVLKQMAKREAVLEKEMESLKEALNGAVVTLKNTIKEEEEAEKLAKEKENEVDVDGASGKESEGEGKQTRSRLRRHFNYQKNPYRACVEIEKINEDELTGRDQYSASSRSQFDSNQAAPNLATVREYMPSKTDSHSQSSQYQPAKSPITIEYSSHESKETFRQPPPPRIPPRPLPMIPQSRPITEVRTIEKDIDVHSTRNNNGPPLVQSYRNSDQSNQQSQFRSSVKGGSNDQSSQFSAYQNSRAGGTFNNNAQQSSQSQQSYHQTSNAQGSSNNYQDHMNDVDLSEVYWLRLDPQRKQELLHQKVDKLLKEKQNQNKDVLVIPLKHGLRDTEEVKTGFLRAVRVRPKALTHKLFRKLRSLKVYEL